MDAVFIGQTNWELRLNTSDGVGVTPKRIVKAVRRVVITRPHAIQIKAAHLATRQEEAVRNGAVATRIVQIPAFERRTKGYLFVQHLRLRPCGRGRLDKGGVPEPEFLSKAQDRSTIDVKTRPACIPCVGIAERMGPLPIQRDISRDNWRQRGRSISQVRITALDVCLQTAIFADAKGQGRTDGEALGIVVR